MGTSIEIDGVCKSFRQADGSSLDVLDDITFTTDSRDFICILGPSGCGKSTLLNIVAGLDHPTRGEVRFRGRSENPQVAFVFQDPRLLDWRTVADNIRLALRGMSVPKGEWGERIERYLDMVGLADFADEYPQSLSGGMKQRVALARALAVDSEVILMDEPFGSLDEITARELREDLVEIWLTEQKTILFVTHNALEAAYLGQRILVMSQRPASIVKNHSIDLPLPRELSDPDVIEISEECIEALHRHI